MVSHSLRLAFVTTGLTHTVFVRTRSIHTLVLPQLDHQETFLPMTLASGKTRMSHPPVLDALSSGRRRCNPADLKMPLLRPRNRTWIRNRHRSRLAFLQLRQRFSSTTRRILRFCYLRCLAVCSNSSCPRDPRRDQRFHKNSYQMQRWTQ